MPENAFASSLISSDESPLLQHPWRCCGEARRPEHLVDWCFFLHSHCGMRVSMSEIGSWLAWWVRKRAQCCGTHSHLAEEGPPSSSLRALVTMVIVHTADGGSSVVGDFPEKRSVSRQPRGVIAPPVEVWG